MSPLSPTSRQAGELIRQAEKQINAGHYAQARSLLDHARAVDPENDYIDAIVERLAILDAGSKEFDDVAAPLVSPPADAPPSVTVSQPGPSPSSELETRIHQLVMAARELYERGSYDSAFEVLTKAYIIDPLNDDVVAMERLLVPALETMRQRGTMTQTADGHSATVQTLRQHGASAEKKPAAPLSHATLSDQARMERLIRQKEQERLEKERAMWRKASETRQPDSAPESVVPSGQQPLSPPEKPQPGGILSRLRGKLSG